MKLVEFKVILKLVTLINYKYTLFKPFTSIREGIFIYL
jgi:hypothetical protein